MISRFDSDEGMRGHLVSIAFTKSKLNTSTADYTAMNDL